MTVNEKRLHSIIISEIKNIIAENSDNIYSENRYKVFEYLNANGFHGSLPSCDIKPLNDNSRFGRFDYRLDNKGRLQKGSAVIYINFNFNYDRDTYYSVMAHEMIHYYLVLKGIDINGNHKDEFNRMATELNNKLGLHIAETMDSSQIEYNPTVFKPSSSLLYVMELCMTSLKQYLPQIKQEAQNKGGNVYEFYNTLYQFTENVIQALKKAISTKKINEIADYMNPLSLIRNAKHDFKRGYRWADRFINSFKSDKDNKKDALLKQASRDSLLYLIFSVYPKIKKKYDKIQLDNNSKLIINEFNLLDDLAYRIDSELSR